MTASTHNNEATMAKKKKSFEDILEIIRDKQTEVDDLLNDLEDIHNECSGSEDQDDWSNDEEEDTDEE